MPCRYLAYLEANPQSLLTRFIGAHSIDMCAYPLRLRHGSGSAWLGSARLGSGSALWAIRTCTGVAFAPSERQGVRGCAAPARPALLH
jgi:hypothetical protein